MSVFDHNAIVRAVHDLGFPAGTAVLHASAAMVLHGLLAEAGDIDMAVNELGWPHALTLGPAQAAAVDLVVRPASGIELFSGWLGQPLDSLFAAARLHHGVLVAAPEHILEFKLRLDRPKDQEHIRLLREYTCNNH